MKRVIAIAGALILGGTVTGTIADEIQGRVKSVDVRERVISLEDGTRMWLAEGVPLLAVQQGAAVKAVYEHRDGKKIATSITPTLTPRPPEHFEQP